VYLPYRFENDFVVKVKRKEVGDPFLIKKGRTWDVLP